MTRSTPSPLGQSHLRREDERLLRGNGLYTADVHVDELLHVAFVRSTMPRSTIEECDTESALECEGVQAVFTGADVKHLGDLSIAPMMDVSGKPEYPILAYQTVAAVGQPLAAVIAQTQNLALDGSDAVFVDLEEICEPPSDEVRVSGTWNTGEVEALFSSADHVVSARVDHPRLAPSPMEPRAITVEYQASTDTATVWLSTQTPHRARLELAKILCICESRIRVIAPDVGGAFGMKAALYPEDVFVVWASFTLKRSLQWVASRSEEFLSATHGRGCTSTGQMAVSRDGTFLAVKASMDLPLGHWLPTSAIIPAWNAGRMIPTGYRIDAVESSSLGTSSDKAAVGIYRGAGRPEANCLMERLVDEAARITHIDPVQIRLKNLVNDEDFPFTTTSGCVLDSGQYHKALQTLVDSVDYASRIKRRDARQANGELAGIGVAFYIEPCGIGWESARVTLHPDGTVLAATGGSTQGHGRETAIAQIVASQLDVSVDDVTVHHGDTGTCPLGIGALASRSTAIGGSAMVQACRKVLEKARQSGDSESVTADVIYKNDGEAWGYGCYLVEVSVERATGVVTIESASCVDDVGVIVNPTLVEGQIVGGFAQGLGEALLEEVRYDEFGQLLTGSFSDYALPRAAAIPKLDIIKLSTPSPNNSLGAKGVGEAGTIGAPAAILNAAIDALRPLGVTHLSMPLTSQRVWEAIEEATCQETL